MDQPERAGRGVIMSNLLLLVFAGARNGALDRRGDSIEVSGFWAINEHKSWGIATYKKPTVRWAFLSLSV